MTTIDDVEDFLRLLKVKIRIYGILYYDDRGKNIATLAELEITPNSRDQVIEGLEAADYCYGPIENSLTEDGELWVFGKVVKKKGSVHQNNAGAS